MDVSSGGVSDELGNGRGWGLNAVTVISLNCGSHPMTSMVQDAGSRCFLT